MSRTFKMLISNWPRTRKFNRLIPLHAGKAIEKAISFDFSHCHALIMLYVQYLCSDWSKFDRWDHAASGNLLTDSWRWQSIVSSCDVLNCLFLLDVQNEIQQLSRLFCNSWLVCYCAFCWQMHRLSKSLEIRFRMALFSKMSLLTCPCLRRKRVEKSQAILEH